MTEDQHTALDRAMACLSQHGDGFADVGALTILQEMVVKTHNIELLEADAQWLKSLIQNPIADGETSADASRRLQLWEAFEAAGVSTR